MTRVRLSALQRAALLLVLGLSGSGCAATPAKELFGRAREAAPLDSDPVGATWGPAERQPGPKTRLAETEGLVQQLIEDNQKLHSKIDLLQGLVNELCRRSGVPSAASANGEARRTSVVTAK